VRVVQLESGDTSTLDALKEALARRASTLSDRVDLWLAGTASRLLLVVDQFEEVFTQAEDPDDRRAFIENLLHAATVAGGRATVVLTLRVDFLGRALDHSRALAEAVKASQELVLPMAPDQLRAAIERPALQRGSGSMRGSSARWPMLWRGSPATCPSSSSTLRELWLRRERTRLTWTAYTAIGGVRGAIAARAEAFLAAPDLDDRMRGELRRVRVRLVEVREHAADTRRRAPRAELESLGSTAIRPVLDRLIAERLLTAAEEGVEVAHEALIREWKTLREWVNADREFLLWRERFRGLLAEWQRPDKDPGALLPLALLAEAERRLAERPDELGAADHEYIGAGGAHREDARRVEVERQRVEQERRERDIRFGRRRRARADGGATARDRRAGCRRGRLQEVGPLPHGGTEPASGRASVARCPSESGTSPSRPRHPALVAGDRARPGPGATAGTQEVRPLSMMAATPERIGAPAGGPHGRRW
jgi:hypothetical protein